MAEWLSSPDWDQIVGPDVDRGALFTFLNVTR